MGGIGSLEHVEVDQKAELFGILRRVGIATP